MKGATAWNPASASAGRRSDQVWGVSGKPCRHSTSGPSPASMAAKRSPFASIVRS